MNFYILTLFPQMVEEGLNTSIIGRASEAGVLHIEAVDIRAYSANKHHKVDDYPYGGGAGMLMQAQRSTMRGKLWQTASGKSRAASTSRLRGAFSANRKRKSLPWRKI